MAGERGQADRRAGWGTPVAGNYIFTWCTVEWGPRQGGVADVAAKVTQSKRSSAKSKREKVAPLGPWAISHFNPLQGGGQASRQAGEGAYAG